ncbi:hypothetical protein B0H13DRAFT_2539427 [Mycena leptocephala]|nr:hypothetical protein B0H13DRAFT_2539427 [Mycena leptocephala]
MLFYQIGRLPSARGSEYGCAPPATYQAKSTGIPRAKARTRQVLVSESALTAHYGERPSAARREMVGEYASVPPRVEDGKERKLILELTDLRPARPLPFPPPSLSPVGEAYPSQSLRAPSDRFIPPIPALPQLQATRDARVAAQLLRIPTPHSTSTQAFGFDKEENMYTRRRRGRRRGQHIRVQSKRGAATGWIAIEGLDSGWIGEWIAKNGVVLHIAVRKRAARGRNVGHGYVLEQEPDWRRAAQGAHSHWQRVRVRRLIELHGERASRRTTPPRCMVLTQLGSAGHSGACGHAVTVPGAPTTKENGEAEICEREETDAPLTTHHTLRSIHTRAVLILVSGLVAFQGVNVPEVESEAARAKRCQRKKGDIGQRGARKRCSDLKGPGENAATAAAVRGTDAALRGIDAAVAVQLPRREKSAAHYLSPSTAGWKAQI